MNSNIFDEDSDDIWINGKGVSLEAPFFHWELSRINEMNSLLMAETGWDGFVARQTVRGGGVFSVFIWMRLPFFVPSTAK